MPRPRVPWVERVYAWLLGAYPAEFRRRFGDGMRQTFRDLGRERRAAGRSTLPFVVGTFAETIWAILKERGASMSPPVAAFCRVAGLTAALLVIPLGAMRFTDAVRWDLTDFAVGGALLFGFGLAFELARQRAARAAHRLAFGLAVFGGVLLVWMSLAVGLLGNEENPANLLYAGVIGIGVVGATVVRLRPAGLARVLFLMAAAQALVPGFALLIFRPAIQFDAGLLGVLALNGFFVALFAISGALFRRPALSRRDVVT